MPNARASEAGGAWLVFGGQGPESQEDFKNLARIAAVELGHPEGADAWTAWLDYLKADGNGFLGGWTGTTAIRKAPRRGKEIWRQIMRVVTSLSSQGVDPRREEM